MKTKTQILAAGAALLALLLYAAWPAGGFSRESCLDDASRRPTDAGVTVATRLCYERFPQQ